MMLKYGGFVGRVFVVFLSLRFCLFRLFCFVLSFGVNFCLRFSCKFDDEHRGQLVSGRFVISVSCFSYLLGHKL